MTAETVQDTQTDMVKVLAAGCCFHLVSLCAVLTIRSVYTCLWAEVISRLMNCNYYVIIRCSNQFGTSSVPYCKAMGRR